MGNCKQEKRVQVWAREAEKRKADSMERGDCMEEPGYQ